MRTEQYNTCNAWGFGGSVGTLTVYSNGIRVCRGRTYYRHTGSSTHFTVEMSGKKFGSDYPLSIWGVNDKTDFDAIREVYHVKGEDNRMDCIFVGTEDELQPFLTKINKASYHTAYDIANVVKVDVYQPAI